MPQLIKPGETKVVTKDGECHVSISLELTIKLEGDVVQVQALGAKAEPVPAPKVEEPAWQIPDFSSGKKIKFGQNA
jgi:hypothetical protein